MDHGNNGTRADVTDFHKPNNSVHDEDLILEGAVQVSDDIHLPAIHSRQNTTQSNNSNNSNNTGTTDPSMSPRLGYSNEDPSFDRSHDVSVQGHEGDRSHERKEFEEQIQPLHANPANTNGPTRSDNGTAMYGNSDNLPRRPQIEPLMGLKKSMTTMFRRPEEVWTLYKAARLIMLQLRIIRTFSANRRAYEHICETCKKLELHQNKFIISHHSSDRRQQAYNSLLATDRAAGPSGSGSGSRLHNLGTHGSIKERSKRCPFCKLVIHSLEDLTSNPNHKESIKKCQDENKKYEDDIETYEREIQKCESEISKRCLEHARPSQDHDTEHEKTCTEKLVASIQAYGETMRKMKDEIKRCREGIEKNTQDIERHRTAKHTFRAQLTNATCHASFQIDGREVERDESGNVIASRPRTRRIQLSWSDPALEPSCIVLVAPEPGRGYDTDQRHMWESDTLFLARSIRSANKNEALVKSWVDLCCTHHGKHCNKEPDDEFHNLTSKAFFGVVDVAEMRLTSLPPGEKYVALSYTWGQQPLYTTNLSNIQLHQEYGGLEKCFAHLPKVIRDTIHLVRSLGQRYLWVDSLCIVQQNDISWNLNSSVMDLVYGNAYVTICAAEGEGAQMGLRGLDPKRKVSQYIEECAKKLRLTISHLAKAYIEKSRWNTRGWTFQERLLSRRCIIFVGDRVFFQCRSTALSEDIIGEQESAGWSIELVQAPLQMLLDVGTKAFSVYMESVRLYTKRDLKDRRDILAAFQGMSNLLGKEMGAPLLFGLPTSYFDLALLWSPTSSCRRRVPGNDDERRTFGDMKFPSWSWCGWSNSAIEYRSEVIGGCLANVNQWLKEHTWIKWFVRDGKGDLRPIWSRSQTSPLNDDTYAEARWLGYRCSPDPRHDDYGRIVKKEYLQHEGKELPRSTFKRTLLEYPFGISEVKAGSGEACAYADQPYLQFWTWSAHLRVTRRDYAESGTDDEVSDSMGHSPIQKVPDPGPGLIRCDIEDYCGDWCGTIVLNKDWFEGWSKNHEEEKSVHEFIAISEAKDFSEGESDVWTYYIPREREQAEWHLYYVLLVTRQGGIYQREGMGKVFKEAFGKSYLPGKVWKEVVME